MIAKLARIAAYLAVFAVIAGMFWVAISQARVERFIEISSIPGVVPALLLVAFALLLAGVWRSNRH